MNAGSTRTSNPSRTPSTGTPQASQTRQQQQPVERAYEAPPEEQRSGTQPNARPSRAPSHIAYHVRELQGRKDKKAIWTRIGSAWPHHDGNGFNIQIEVVPLDGKITLRVAEDQRDK